MSSPKSLSGWRANLAVFGGLFLLSLILQWHSGAYRSDFGAHADEAAHVVTGLMVRDYLAGGFLEQPHPMRFAEDYYERFPKVAIGHYPPLFYLVEGLWLIPFRSGPAVLVLMAFLSAAAGWLTWRAGREFLNSPAAIAAALVFCLLPLVRTYTAVVMSDLLLVSFCLGAVTALGKFLEQGRARDSLLFGLLAAAAILTKGSGLFLALVPPIAIVLSGRFSLLKQWPLWIAPLPVLLLAFPWILLTRHITAEGMKSMPLPEYLPEALAYYGSALVKEFGLFILIAATASLVGGFVRAIRKREGVSIPLSIHAAAVLGLLAFFCVIPSGFDARYLLPAAPALLLLVFSLLPFRIAGAVVLGILCLVPTHRPVTKLYTGASDTIESIRSESDPETEAVAVLVSTSPNGEGALVAAAALIDPDRFRVIRASKALAESDWLGREYRSRFETAGELLAFLESETIDFLVLDDDIPEAHYHPHHALLEKTAEQNPDRLDSAGAAIRSRRKVHGEGEFIILRLRHRDSLDFDGE